MKVTITILCLIVGSFAAHASDVKVLNCTMHFGQRSTGGALYRIQAVESSSAKSFERVRIEAYQTNGSFIRPIANYGQLVELKRIGNGIVFKFKPDDSLMTISFPTNFKSEENRRAFNARLNINDPSTKRAYRDVGMTCSLKTTAEINN